MKPVAVAGLVAFSVAQTGHPNAAALAADPVVLGATLATAAAAGLAAAGLCLVPIAAARAAAGSAAALRRKLP